MSHDKYAHCRFGYPARHRRKVPFSPDIRVPDGFLARMTEITDLDHELDRFILSESNYRELVAQAIASNVHQSVRLEGNPLSAQVVRKLTRDSLRAGATRSPKAMPTPHHQEILNHVFVWQNPGPLATAWAPATIGSVHGFLFEQGEVVDKPGEFRGGTNEPSEVLTDQGQVIFITAPSGVVEEELASLCVWLGRTGAALFPVVAAAVFFHELESIHPFWDGNGRTGRTLFHTYLQLNGLRNAHLCMIEQELAGSDPELYYRILGWTDSSGSYTELIDYFVDGVLAAYRKAHRRLAKLDLLSTSLDETAKRILVRAKREKDWFSVRQASSWVSKRSDQTIRRNLNSLVKAGALHTRGKTVAKRYRFAAPFSIPRPGGPPGDQGRTTRR